MRWLTSTPTEGGKPWRILLLENLKWKGRAPKPAWEPKPDRWLNSRLTPGRPSLFHDLKGEEFLSLVRSLEDEGLNFPIEVTADNVIIDGHQRLRAAMQLGWKEIKVRVRHDLRDQYEIDKRHIEANLTRRQLSKLDQVRLIKARCGLERNRTRNPGNDERGDVRDRVAKQFGMDGRTAQRWMNVLDTPPEVQEACSEGRLSMGLAERVKRLTKDEQRLLAAEIRQGRDPEKVVKSYLPTVKREVDRRKEFPRCVGELVKIMRLFDPSNGALT